MTEPPSPADPDSDQPGQRIDVSTDIPLYPAAKTPAAGSLASVGKRGRRRGSQRSVRLPLILFLATCASTFWVGSTGWRPQDFFSLERPAAMLQVMLANWQVGLTYMGALLGILMAHEMGHFVMTLRHRIPASYPLFIPVPINAIGTMGAVISMDGRRANPVQIFDIGLAGPLAGLVVAIPVLWLGVQQLNLNTSPLPGEVQLYNPVIVRWMIQYLHPELPERVYWIGISQVNALFMAGWVGMLITGLNMLPVSQLDGGHTIHGLFGKQSYKISQAFTMVAIAYVVIHLEQAAIWTVMLVLVILMGIHHPPTSDDSMELDDTRWIIGMASMAIPILCFPLLGLRA